MIDNNKVFSITENQLNDLIEKIKNNVKNKTNKRGEYSIGLEIGQSISDIIKTYLVRNCIYKED